MTHPPPRIHRPVLIAVLHALKSIFGYGALAEQVVDEVLRHSPKWGARDRRMFAGTVYELVRWWRREAWRAGLDDAAAFGPRLDLDACARVWTAWWTARGAAVPDLPELSAAARNAATTARNPEAAPPAVRASLPEWLDQAGAAAMGAAWPALRDALNEPADVWLRANTLRMSPSDLIAALAREGVTATPAAASGRRPDALRLPSRQRLADTAAYRAGLFEVQDAGSQEIAPFLHPRRGDFVIDSCAGAGGKSLHLAALMHNEGRILALDIHPWKLAALDKRAARAGVTCLRHHAITTPDDLTRHAGSADRLLIDAPCSGLGVLRRHPDTKWKSSPAELDRLVRLQAEILDSHSSLLKPGGTLVYATCSFLPQENSGQIRAFLARQPAGAWTLEEERLLLPAPGDPDANHDAFYMARLRNSPP